LQRRLADTFKVRATTPGRWPPMMFDNAVEKVQDYLDLMKDPGPYPSSNASMSVSCAGVGMYGRPACIPVRWIQICHGCRLRHAADPELLPDPLRLKLPEAHWQVTAIGRAEIWPLPSAACAELAVTCAPGSKIRSISPMAPR